MPDDADLRLANAAIVRGSFADHLTRVGIKLVVSRGWWEMAEAA